jgi:hypothetical protein
LPESPKLPKNAGIEKPFNPEPFWHSLAIPAILAIFSFSSGSLGKKQHLHENSR